MVVFSVFLLEWAIAFLTSLKKAILKKSLGNPAINQQCSLKSA